jgi:peroxiredoxin
VTFEPELRPGPPVSDYQQLPSNLPVPQDDGATDHLPGAAMPPLVLRDTSGNEVALDQLGPGRTVICIYPLSGRPGVDLPTFEAAGERLFSRLTMIVTDGRIEHAFYPIFPPDQHAAEVMEWLRGPAAVGPSA